MPVIRGRAAICSDGDRPMDQVTFTTEDGIRLEGELRMPDGAPRGAPWSVTPTLSTAGGRTIRCSGRSATTSPPPADSRSSGSTSAASWIVGHLRGRPRRAPRHARRDRGSPVALGAQGPPTVVVGWSFGASVALREALDDARVSALALVGIPLRPGDVEMPPLPDRTDLRLFARPAMLLAGEHDRYAPPEDLRAYGALFPQAEVVVVPGTDHYFWRREREAASVVGAFADRVLNRP